MQTLEESVLTVPKKKVALMKAATLTEPGKFVIQETQIPEPGKDEVLIKMTGCGICASNLPPFEGRSWFHYPMDQGGLGREGWGIVDKVGENVTRFKPGDAVTALSFHAFAEYDIAEESNAVKLPESLRDNPFPGEPLGSAMNIIKRCDIREDQTVAIIGAGFLGCLLIQLAKLKKARVIAISKRKSSLNLAQEMGADEVIAFDDDPIQQIKDLTKGKLCDRVIEATGKQNPLNIAAELTANRGKLIVAGYHQDGLRQINMQLWNWRGIDVVNTHERDPEIYVQGIEEAVKAVQDGKLNPYPLFTHYFSFNFIQQAFETIRNKPEGYSKALITF